MTKKCWWVNRPSGHFDGSRSDVVSFHSSQHPQLLREDEDQGAAPDSGRKRHQVGQALEGEQVQERLSRGLL